MGDTQVNVSQEIGQIQGGGQATAVKLNVYSYFKATPANLRRSFDALMQDKLCGFVGRQFVFDAVDDFLRKHDSGCFIIRGVPGIGKTALMAKLVNDRGYIHHFNVASQNVRSPRVFLENVCAQLIDRYELEHTDLFRRTVDIINKKFMPIIERHALSGRSIVNTEAPVFEDPLALFMLIDIFSERGFHATVDKQVQRVAERVDLETGEIQGRLKFVYRIQIHFRGSEIRKP